MLQIQRDVDLRSFNTFNVSAKASLFALVKSPEELAELVLGQKFLVIGCGANVLFTKDFDGLVIKNEIKGREIVQDNETSIVVSVASGENWHEFVLWAVNNNLSGIENLAYIPGTVGAAPVQNIAAYGQTAGEVIESVSGFYVGDLKKVEKLNQVECQFYYRDSIFKHALKDKFFVTAVTFKLSKTSKFDTNYHGRASYESLAGELAKFATAPYCPKDIAEAVTRMRKIKLPDWHTVGTAGSFFKNPFVSKEKFESLKMTMSDLQAYPVDHMLYPNPDDPVFKMADMVKIPVGRLLDELGWKGKRIGNVGTFEKHALVVVNFGGATGQEILEFTQKMQEDVKKNFGINLESEVNII